MEINTVSIVGLGAGGNLLIRHIIRPPVIKTAFRQAKLHA